LPSGRISLSNGVLWHRYSEAAICFDAIPVPRALVICQARIEDLEFLDHPWLVEMYPKVLEGMRATDPLFEQQMWRRTRGSRYRWQPQRRPVIVVMEAGPSTFNFTGSISYLTPEVDCIINVERCCSNLLNYPTR